MPGSCRDHKGRDETQLQAAPLPEGSLTLLHGPSGVLSVRCADVDVGMDILALLLRKFFVLIPSSSLDNSTA